MHASRSRSTYWLNAPALADDSSTASASTTICQISGRGPGVTAMPASAHSMIATPIRSLNTDSRWPAVTDSGPARGWRDGLGSGIAAQPSGQISERYFQLTK